MSPRVACGIYDVLSCNLFNFLETCLSFLSNATDWTMTANYWQLVKSYFMEPPSRTLHCLVFPDLTCRVRRCRVGKKFSLQGWAKMFVPGCRSIFIPGPDCYQQSAQLTELWGSSDTSTFHCAKWSVSKCFPALVDNKQIVDDAVGQHQSPCECPLLVSSDQASAMEVWWWFCVVVGILTIEFGCKLQCRVVQ